MRAWRHPSELGDLPPPPPALHRGIVAGTAVVTLLAVVGVSRLLVPGSVDDQVVSADRRPIVSASVISTTDAPRASAAPRTTVTVAPVVVSSSTSSPTPATTPTTPSAPTPAPRPAGAVDLAAIPTSREGVFAVAIQPGVLYVTTDKAVGDSHALQLSVDDGQLIGRVLTVDEEVGIALLHVAATDIDPVALDRISDMSELPDERDPVRIVQPNDDLGAVTATVGASDDKGHELRLDGESVGESVGDGMPVTDVDGRLVGLTSALGTRLIDLTSLHDAFDAAAESALGRQVVTDSIGIAVIDVERIDDCAGVQVLDVVADSPSEAADLRPGDVIVGFAPPDAPARAVHSTADLLLDLRNVDGGDSVTLVVQRTGQALEVRMTLPAMTFG